MKISILIVDDEKQIMMTPENDYEQNALKMIAPNDKIEAVTKWGTYDDEETMVGMKSSKCQGGYYRRYSCSDSLMFILTPKKEKK